MRRRRAVTGGLAHRLLCGVVLWPCAGCIMPGLVQPNIQLCVSDAAHEGSAERRIVVLQYWQRDSGEVIGPLRAHVLTGTELRLVYPVRVYPIIWTPALGFQHSLPRPGVAAFSTSGRPVFATSNCGRNCCQAPGLGPYRLELELDRGELARVAEESHDWYHTPCALAALAARVDRVDRALAAARGVTADDRAMVFGQLAAEATSWRDSAQAPTRVPRERLTAAAEVFERQAAAASTAAGAGEER